MPNGSIPQDALDAIEDAVDKCADSNEYACAAAAFFTHGTNEHNTIIEAVQAIGTASERLSSLLIPYVEP